MGKKRRARQAEAAGPFDYDETVVVVCRGGDCGSRRKHPETDHLGQLEQVRRGTASSAVVATSKCLDACEHSNVIVVIPGKRAARVDPAPVWVGTVNSPEVTQDLVDWITAGGPAVVPAPVSIDIATFAPTRRNRHELESGAVILPSTSPR